MEHLIRKGDWFYYRGRVPKDLRRFIPFNEIKKSLKTRDHKNAKLLVKTLSLKIEFVLTLIRGNMLTDEQIKHIVKKHLIDIFKETEDARALGIRVPKDEDDLTDELDLQSTLESDCKKSLAYNDLSKVKHAADLLLEEHGLTVSKDSLEYKKLCRELLKASVTFLEIEQQRLVGNYKDIYVESFSDMTSSAVPKKPKGKLLSQVITEYVAEKKHKKAWSIKNAKENEVFYEQLLEILGDREIQDYTRANFLEYAELLTKFPANLNKKHEFKDKSLKELVPLVRKGEIVYKPISTRTVNKNLVRVNSLFIYAQKQGYIIVNYADGLGVKNTKKDDEQREKFTTYDLNKLLASPVYKRVSKKRPERFWIPLIALFSGCRLGEICQLYKSDIKVIKDVYCFDINDEKDKRLKNLSSKRIVPVSQVLIDMGFLDYVGSVTHERLWSNLKQHRDGYGHSFTRWYQTYNRTYISKNPKKVFHSFRHTFIDNLKQQNVNETVIAELVGHSLDSITLGRYGKKYNVQVLLDAIRKLDYGVDVGNLRFPL